MYLLKILDAVPDPQRPLNLSSHGVSLIWSGRGRVSKGPLRGVAMLDARRGAVLLLMAPVRYGNCRVRGSRRCLRSRTTVPAWCCVLCLVAVRAEIRRCNSVLGA